MSVTQSIISGIIYWLAEANLPFVGLWTLQRHLVCGFLTGCVLGDPVMGAVVGATINLAYLGFISAGGSMPADMALAGVLGVSYAIVGGLDADTALAQQVPVPYRRPGRPRWPRKRPARLPEPYLQAWSRRQR